MVKNLLLWLVIAVVLMSVFSNVGVHQGATQSIDYSEFLHKVRQGEVRKVIIDERAIVGIDSMNKPFDTYMPMEDKGLMADLINYNVSI